MSETQDARRQHRRNLQGEIAFRAKLARQHVTGEVLLPDYYRREEHDNILRERVEATRAKMVELTRAGVSLSPFLELGAEIDQVLAGHGIVDLQGRGRVHDEARRIQRGADDTHDECAGGRAAGVVDRGDPAVGAVAGERAALITLDVVNGER